MPLNLALTSIKRLEGNISGRFYSISLEIRNLVK